MAMGLCWVRLKKGTKQQTIPIKIIEGLPFITVHLNGQKFGLLLDLGARDSTLSEEIITNCGLTKTEKTVNSMDVYGTRSTKPVFSSSNIYIGNYFVPQLNFSTLPQFDFSTSSLIHGPLKVLNNGFIGRTPFLEKVLLIDYKNELCIIYPSDSRKKTDPRKYEQGEWIELDFQLKTGLGIDLCLLINSEKTDKIILDTGANASVISNSLTKVPIDLSSEDANLSIKLNNGTCLGTFLFHPQDLTNPGLNGILGCNFFSKYVVCIDFPNEKIFLKHHKQ